MLHRKYKKKIIEDCEPHQHRPESCRLQFRLKVLICSFNSPSISALHMPATIASALIGNAKFIQFTIAPIFNSLKVSNYIFTTVSNTKDSVVKYPLNTGFCDIDTHITYLDKT